MLVEIEPTSLLRRMRDGDEAAARQFYRAYSPVVKRFLLRSGWEYSLVEDALQATMIEVWKHPERYQSNRGASFKSWLLSIAKFRLTDMLRKQSLQVTDLDEERMSSDQDDGYEPSRPDKDIDDVEQEEGYARLHQQQRRHAVEQCLDRLKGIHRQLLCMAYEHELPGREIAEALGMPEGTVKSTLHYAKNLMRKCLDRRLQEAG